MNKIEIKKMEKEMSNILKKWSKYGNISHAELYRRDKKTYTEYVCDLEKYHSLKLLILNYKMKKKIC